LLEFLFKKIYFAYAFQDLFTFLIKWPFWSTSLDDLGLMFGLYLKNSCSHNAVAHHKGEEAYMGQQKGDHLPSHLRQKQEQKNRSCDIFMSLRQEIT
jgi:hypothetical protein